MKRGVIFYVTEGRDGLAEKDFDQPLQALGYDAMCYATNEFEISYWWYILLTKGVQEIVCRRASYQREQDAFIPESTTLRLCG